MNLEKLQKRGLITPPQFLPNNTHYLVMMGSEAYGCFSGNSDMDIYGWCVPPKEMIFPHTVGEIPGFGKQIKRFEVWQEHHIEDKDAGKQYDFAIYSVVRFFQLCMENNPNMVDSLFVPQRCVLHCTNIAEQVREQRKMFLHKGCYQKLRGYSFSQLHKMEIKQPKEGSKRYEIIKEHGIETKFAYHVVRLLLECEQILVEHDLDLERNSEILKSIRRGEWTKERIHDFFTQKERHLDDLYNKSTLPWGPDEKSIKLLLLKVIESHYGSLSKADIEIPGVEKAAILEIRSILGKYGY